MPDTPGPAAQAPPIQFSLVLRCWLTPAGVLTGAIVEIPSGIRHGFGDTDTLIAELQRIIAVYLTGFCSHSPDDSQNGD